MNLRVFYLTRWGLSDGYLLLFSERGTRHDRTLDETRPNVGRDAVERGTAFAI